MSFQKGMILKIFLNYFFYAAVGLIFSQLVITEICEFHTSVNHDQL